MIAEALKAHKPTRWTKEDGGDEILRCCELDFVEPDAWGQWAEHVEAAEAARDALRSVQVVGRSKSLVRFSCPGCGWSFHWASDTGQQRLDEHMSEVCRARAKAQPNGSER